MTDTDRPDKSKGATTAKQPADGGRGGKSGTPPADSKQPKKSGRGALIIAIVALVIALLAAIATAVLGYLGQQEAQQFSERVATAGDAQKANIDNELVPRIEELNTRVDEFSSKLDGLASRDDELAGKVDQNNSSITDLGEALREKLSKELGETQAQLTELSQLVQGGRQRWQMLVLEDLLVAANQRLQLHRDPAGAKRALALVDRRLAKRNNPKLFDIRRKIADEIAAVEALPNPDVSGLALAVTALIERVDKFPLATDVPNEFKSKTGSKGGGQKSADKNGEGGGSALESAKAAWQHFANSVTQALSGMFTIRRGGGAIEPLMSPKQEFFLRQNLILKLQEARLALIDRDAEIYRARLTNAAEWLQTYFDPNSPAVQGALSKIEEIKKVRIEWEAPDISDSLAALREFVKQSSAEKSSGGGGSNGSDGQSKPGAGQSNGNRQSSGNQASSRPSDGSGGNSQSRSNGISSGKSGPPDEGGAAGGDSGAGNSQSGNKSGGAPEAAQGAGQ